MSRRCGTVRHEWTRESGSVAGSGVVAGAGGVEGALAVVVFGSLKIQLRRAGWLRVREREVRCLRNGAKLPR